MTLSTIKNWLGGLLFVVLFFAAEAAVQAVEQLT